MRKYLLSLFTAVFTLCIAFAQTSNAQVIVRGKVLDAQTKDPLIGATILVKGTSKATTAALDGSFKVNMASASGAVVISYVGYVTKEVEVTGDNLGTLLLSPNSASVKEVVVTANPSIKINRETPIAASSVNQVYIDEKGPGAEFPELMEMTPGTTVSRVGGGYGDSRITIRGFSSNNTALLINGIPVNDPEAGKIYWNDWAGLQDVTTSMQVQRGLGASTIAVPSVGGTINISTRTTEANPGGVISQSVGSYGEEKTLISYSTGLSDNGWASSFLLSRATGTSPGAEGLYYTGYNYFANISKIIGKNQSLSFDFMGASQRHGQRYTYNTIATYRNAPQGTRYDSDWGYLNGQIYSAEQNFYNKPLASLKYNWFINPSTSWSTIAYASWGTGAADYLTSKSGVSFTLLPGQSNEIPRTGGTYSPIDFNAITKNNLTSTDGSANYYMQNANNNHQQYGVISSLQKKVGDITYLAGIDMRYYEGEHFNTVDNLFGASYVQDTYSAFSVSGDINNPNNQAVTGDKFNNDYRYEILQEGIYGQVEYKKNDLSAFLTLAGTNTGNRRIDYFNYLTTDPNRETKWLNFLGYQAKGGANYNLDANNNVYANIGYIQRAPLVAALFLNKNNTINPNGRPEKLFDYELGYGYESALFSLKANAYMATYSDISKVYAASTANADGTINTININGLSELHEGIELEGKLHPVQWITIGGMFSINNYKYNNNTASGQITSPNSKPTNVPQLFLKGLPIGNIGTAPTSAQTTTGGDIELKVLPQVKIGATYLYYARYYASYDPTNITAAGYQPYKLPDYGVANLDVVYRFKMAGFNAEFVGNVYNLFNTTYLSDAFDQSPLLSTNFVNRTNSLGVFYGAGRYYMTTLRIKF
jgi:hypothetical protein